MGKPEGKRQFGKPGRRRDDNIKMDLQQVGWGGDTDWTDLVQDRDTWQGLVNEAVSLKVP